MKQRIVCLLLGLSGCFLPIQAQNIPVYLDESKTIEERVEDALSRMTIEEKIALLHAQSKFSSAGAPRLGIPEVWMTDGPHGIRPEVLWDEWAQAGWTNDSCTAFPALTALAATWNPELAMNYGKAIGEEARYRKKTVLLGPGVNIYRTPLNGRNFEYMGEDPYLASRMVVPYVVGVQSNGVAACVKHFALNNQETERGTIDVVADERALREIYLPAFKAAVQEGQVWAIMGAYNKYLGEHCSHNAYLLKKILREEWGFNGVVISDWGGVHDTREAIFNGLDMEFGTWTGGDDWSNSDSYSQYFLANPYLELIKAGEVGTAELDEKARNVLRLIFRTEMNRNRPWGKFVSEDHSKTAWEIATESIVLLKNNGNLLPIDVSKAKKIAIIGENAIKKMTVGGGSSSLKAQYEILPLEGLRKYLEPQVEVVYARGYVGDVSTEFDNVSTGQDLRDNRSPEELLKEALVVAKDADYVIFIGGLNKSHEQDSEGADRKSMDLPYGQDKLISELAKVNPNLIVVNISGNAVTMPWVNEVPAIVQAWFLGSEAGHAIASVLCGEVNPSGKLPFTFPVKLKDNAAHSLGAYPGNDGKVEYKESILVGYRWHDTKKIKPLFGFGHGLSYTTFEYGKAQLSSSTLSRHEQIICSVEVTNTGNKPGYETVQLYISDLKSSLQRPLKELKAFRKLMLNPGETKTIEFAIDNEMLQFYDDTKSAWVSEDGSFEILIGSSSTDIRTKAKFNLK